MNQLLFALIFKWPLGLKSDDSEGCDCGFSAIASRATAVGQWGGLLIEDEISMVGVEVESDMFHWRERCFLEPCLSTTPQIKSKNGAGLPKPNLKSAAQLLRMIMDESKKVSFYREIDSS